MIWGTCHFRSVSAARAYYGRQGYDAAAVLHKLEVGEIKIGPPTALKPGDKIVMIDDGLRYAIEETS